MIALTPLVIIWPNLFRTGFFGYMNRLLFEFTKLVESCWFLQTGYTSPRALDVFACWAYILGAKLILAMFADDNLDVFAGKVRRPSARFVLMNANRLSGSFSPGHCHLDVLRVGWAVKKVKASFVFFCVAAFYRPMGLFVLINSRGAFLEVCSLEWAFILSTMAFSRLPEERAAGNGHHHCSSGISGGLLCNRMILFLGKMFGHSGWYNRPKTIGICHPVAVSNFWPSATLHP